MELIGWTGLNYWGIYIGLMCCLFKFLLLILWRGDYLGIIPFTIEEESSIYYSFKFFLLRLCKGDYLGMTPFFVKETV